MRVRFAAVLALGLAACAKRPAPPPAAPPGDDGIAWQSWSAGLAQARAENKPVLVVVSAAWCPHCRNYKQVFRDPQVEREAKQFVMVRVDEDREPAVAARYRVDGAYVPRTYFLAPDGSIADVHAQNPRYRYFYDERNPASILAGMTAALAVSSSSAAH